LKLIGTIMTRDNGRPENVYGNWKVPYWQLRHELRLTDFLLCYPESDVLRGHIVNRRIRPDAEMTLNGIFYFVELDTGEQTLSQVCRRQAVYAGVEDFVLYVTTTERRRESLRRNCSEAVRKIALFGVLDDVMRQPHGAVWMDAFGESAAV
jgi:hypothetical protein